MDRKELIPILAEILGVPFKSAWVIDRSLANAGLRHKHKGPNPPDMTRKEALYFLIGCMVADKATKAADDVLPWSSATGLMPWLPEIAPDVDEWEDDPTERLQLYNLLYPSLEPFQSDHTHNPIVGLIDYLLVVCEKIENDEIDTGAVKLEITTSHMNAVVIHSNLHGYEIETHHFSPPDRSAQSAHDQTYQIQRSVSIYGEALAALSLRTANPLDESGNE